MSSSGGAEPSPSLAEIKSSLQCSVWGLIYDPAPSMTCLEDGSPHSQYAPEACRCAASFNFTGAFILKDALFAASCSVLESRCAYRWVTEGSVPHHTHTTAVMMNDGVLRSAKRVSI